MIQPFTAAVVQKDNPKVSSSCFLIFTAHFKKKKKKHNEEHDPELSGIVVSILIW